MPNYEKITEEQEYEIYKKASKKIDNVRTSLVNENLHPTVVDKAFLNKAVGTLLFRYNMTPDEIFTIIEDSIHIHLTPKDQEGVTH